MKYFAIQAAVLLLASSAALAQTGPAPGYTQIDCMDRDAGPTGCWRVPDQSVVGTYSAQEQNRPGAAFRRFDDRRTPSMGGDFDSFARYYGFSR